VVHEGRSRTGPIAGAIVALSLLAIYSAAQAQAPAVPAPAVPASTEAKPPAAPAATTPTEPAAAIAISVPPKPLTADEVAIFDGAPLDPVPRKLDATRADLEGRHYLWCDEANLQLWYPHIKDLGGGYMGVGSDQAYLFIGWMKPRFAWLTDYDPWITWLHRSYAAFFAEAKTPDDFYALWSNGKAKSSRALLERVYADDPERKRIVFVFRQARRVVHRRLRRLRKKMKRVDVPSYVTDQAQYDFVRAMVANGRVNPRRVNLLAAAGMKGVAEEARQLGVPIRVLYMSNAESYWRYGKRFRENVAAQPFDERSLILRTVASKNVNDDYHYNMQPGLNFQRWLAEDWVRSVRQVVPRVRIRGKDHVPLTTTDRDPVKPARRRRRKR